MKRIIKITCLIVFNSLCMLSCSKDSHIIGGNTHNPKVDLTTFDYLKGNSRGLFDTLIIILDAAGLKEMVNQPGVIFFAPTDYSIYNYLSYRTKEEQIIDPFKVWSLDSLLKYDLPKFQDSLQVYFIDIPIQFEDMTEDGTIYKTMHKNDEAIVSYESATPSDPWYNPASSQQARTVHFTFLYQDVEPPVIATEITSDQGARTLVQTAGIETNTGMLNVLNNSHRLFFRKP